MNKREFKRALEDLLFEHFYANRHDKDLTNVISFSYTRKTPNIESHGELVFKSNKKDVVLYLDPIDYTDD
jgi:hypothetical protein